MIIVNKPMAIYALHPNVNHVTGDVAYDENGEVVEYDESAVQAKLAEMQAQADKDEQDAKDAKASAVSKLSALGLTEAEIAALIGA